MPRPDLSMTTEAIQEFLRGPHVGVLSTIDRLGFPPSREIDPWVPATGWTAVSEHMFRMHEHNGGYWYLREHGYRRVGRSIRLYYVP